MDAIEARVKTRLATEKINMEKALPCAKHIVKMCLDKVEGTVGRYNCYKTTVFYANDSEWIGTALCWAKSILETEYGYKVRIDKNYWDPYIGETYHSSINRIDISWEG